MQRRTVLRAVTTGAIGVVAGCVGTGGRATPGSAIEEHPAARELETEPTLGSAKGDVIVEFADPACPTCRRFERNSFPELKRQLVATGEATFTYRVFPVTYPWGKPAVQALEATYAVDADAFWGLKAYYYANQDAFGGGGTDPLDGAREYLSGNTDLDADAIVTAADEKAHDAAVQADLRAGKDAGASSTPTFFVFRDGTYRTKITGAQSVDVFAAALSG